MRAVTFGPPSFETPVGRIGPDADLLFAVVLFVAAEDPLGVPRDDLAELLWPGSRLEAARHSLRQAMYRLRQLGVPIHLRAGVVAIDPEDTEIDLRDLLHGPINRADLIRIGTQPFLPGYSPGVGDRYRAWVEELRDRASAVRRRALSEAIVDARSHARFREIHSLGRALLALDPLNETATLAVAEALVMDGSKVEALQLLDAYEDEVGSVSESLRIPVRTLRRRVSEGLDDALLPHRFEVPFVGRQEEFRQLRESFGGARRGEGQCVVVTGEPGIGKTRTSTELLRLSVLDGAMVVTYHCTSGDALAPLSSLLGLTGHLLNQPGALGCGQEHLTFLRRLLAPDPTQPFVSGVTAELAYAQLVYSLSELVAAITDEGPLVVFVDDAHRLHETSWRLFTDVVNRLPQRRLLLLLASRQLPEWYHTLGITNSDGRARHVRLAPLAATESTVFLDRWSEQNHVALEDTEIQRFADAAAGNPFYLGELAAHRARGGPDHLPPATIRGLIELQFSGLREPAQRVLLVVSLLQSHATLQRVTRVLEVAPMDFLSALDELELAGLVTARGVALRLKHEIIAEVTQAFTMPGVLSYLRARVAALLEEDAGDTDDVDLLTDAVTLWEKAGELQRMTAASLRLGNALLPLCLTSETVAAFDRVIERSDWQADQAAAHLGKSRALTQANDWLGLRATTGQDSVSTHLGSAERAELWLNNSVAEYWTDGTCPPPAQIDALLRSQTAPASVRVRAATFALTLTDNTASRWQLPDMAVLADIARECEHGDATLLLPLVLAVTSDRREEAVSLIDRLVAFADSAPPVIRSNLTRQAAHAALRCGRATMARALFEDAQLYAHHLLAPAAEALCLSMLQRIAAHEADRERAFALVRGIDLLASCNPANPTVARYRLFATAPAAWLSAERSLAQRAVTQLEALGDQRDAERVSSNVSELMLVALGVRRCTDTLLEWIAGDFRKTMRLGCVDHSTIAAAQVLTDNVSTQEAISLLNDFAACRRDVTPIARAHLERLRPEVAAATTSA